MSDDSDFDDQAHQDMLLRVTDASAMKHIKKASAKVSAKDLLHTITTKKNNRVAKNAFVKPKKAGAEEDMEVTEETHTLAPPVHSAQRNRILGAVAAVELNQEFKVWKPIVEQHRTADHLEFGIDREFLARRNASDKAADFRPKTELEIEMAKVLEGSKFNLRNDQELTEAEQEVLQAMNLKEAKSKLNQMRKMRALMSYKLAKDTRTARIKSKKYHRLMKRSRRKQALKEFDDLLTRDPDAAKEKLTELEYERVAERMTQRHGKGGSKFGKDIAKFASTDKRAMALFENHLRLGRELREKVNAGDESESEDSDSEEDEDMEVEEKKKSIHQLLKESAEAAAKEATTAPLTAEQLAKQTMNARITLAQMRDEKRRELEMARVRGSGQATDVAFEEVEWESPSTGDQSAPAEKPAAGEKKQKKTKKKELKKKTKKSEGTLFFKPESPADSGDEEEEAAEMAQMQIKEGGESSSSTAEVAEQQPQRKRRIEEMFDDVEERFKDKLVKELQIQNALDQMEQDEEAPPEAKKGRFTKQGWVKEKEKKEKKKEKEAAAEEADISLDPKYFLKVETSNLAKVSNELEDKMDDFEEDQRNAMAEAFEDDDVMGDFEEEKEEMREKEKGEDLDLHLPGWGAWAGPGIEDDFAKRERFLVKAKEKKRRDNGRSGVIISEKADLAMVKLQPKTVPFPYSRMDDFEAAIRQPLGREWNSQSAHNTLMRPAVTVHAGRVIRPLVKADVLKRDMHASDDEEKELDTEY